ncbi:MAG: molybdenum cofactor biosynthesis protein, partial [Sneathiella sp.]|nr:molybdenum cofactor biosynthesis protein [Sneathiella sp.]
MPGIDESRSFISVKIAVLTVSDTRGLDEDRSGQTLVQRIEDAGQTLADRKIVKDEVADIQSVLKDWISSDKVD